MKLDRMFNEFDDVKNLITLENQRTAYIDDATAIIYGYKQLTENYILEISMVNCTTQRDCRKQKLLIAESYQNHFNIKHRLYKILKGTTESISVFNDPLLDLIKRTHKCNIGEVIKFANGVILLDFKGQQVVIAHEQLTGSNTSIILAVKEWSNLMSSIKNKVEDIKIECYTNINKYIKDDVQDTIYQTNMKSNRKAADSLKKKLDKKYVWLDWTVLSYGSYGSQNHWGFSTFLNMPKSKDDRKRVLRVIAHDKGTYINLQKEMRDVLDDVFSQIHPNDIEFHSAKLLFKMIEGKLKRKTEILPKLSAFIVLRNPTDLQIADESKRFNMIYHVRKYFLLQHVSFFVWASFKSRQQFEGVACPFNCSGEGFPVQKPYSSSCYCRCNTYFQGNNCQHYSGVNLADNQNTMLAASARIPKLTDIYYELLDMKCFVGVSLKSLQNSLQEKVQEKYDNLNRKLTNEFQWTNLITQYAHDIRQLAYYISRFKLLNSSSPSFVNESSALATSILQSGNVPKWTFELNLLIIGRTDILIKHKPLLEIISSRHIDIACNLDYKNALDNENVNPATQQKTDVTDQLRKIAPNLSENQILLITSQIESSSLTHSKGVRWPKEIICMALTIYNRNPSAYKDITRNGWLNLPSESLLYLYKNAVKQKPGIIPTMMAWMKNEAVRLRVETEGYYGGVLLDEMSIQEDLQIVNHGNGTSLFGLVDCEPEVMLMHCSNEGKCESKLANHVMQYIFHGITGFRWPFANYPNAQAAPADIFITTWKCIDALYEWGFKPIYLCMDGSSNNRAFLKMHFPENDPLSRSRRRDALYTSLSKFLAKSLMGSLPGGVAWRRFNKYAYSGSSPLKYHVWPSQNQVHLDALLYRALLYV
ncbi:Hypothetical predicted protein [Mytilus galloprovincialis]|nr:Hypothetical predicted protein [Mytilus galloprovincialis]